MIVSHEHRFIFIALPKTGTTSIETALRPTLGPSDEVGSAGARGKHLGAAAVREHVGEETWSNYRTFAFVRNPYALVVSWYRYLGRLTLRYCIAERGLVEGTRWYLRRSSKRESFATFVRSRTRWTHSQLARLCDPDGNVIVDVLGRHERLAEDFATICRSLELDCELPHLNASGGAGRPSASFASYYDDETRDIVYDHLRRDFELLGYPRDPAATIAPPTSGDVAGLRRAT